MARDACVTLWLQPTLHPETSGETPPWNFPPGVSNQISKFNRMRTMRWKLLLALFSIWPLQQSAAPSNPFIVVLGVAQDGGVPQAGAVSESEWEPSAARLVASLGIVDPRSARRWMIDATPDFKRQLRRLDRIAPVSKRPGLDGIFLTHAHIGHYLGLAQLGHEAMGARGATVFALPRMAQFLRSNGPWDQLIRYGNISITELAAERPVQLGADLTVTPFEAPHRQEYSEVAGYRIEGPNHTALYLPDIDSWRDWDDRGVRIEDEISRVDAAYLDGTFFADGEIPGRDMSGFPHPFISTTIERLSALPERERRKVRFIHLNHTNPALRIDSPQRRRLESAGFRVAEELETFAL